MKKKSYNDEIDLVDLLSYFWKQKYKLIIITSLTFILGLFYHSQLNKKILATTNIKPISISENLNYKIYNSLLNEQNLNLSKLDGGEIYGSPINSALDKENIFNSIIKKNKFSSSLVTRTSLLDLFIDKIKSGELVIEGIEKFKLINKEDFKNDEIYKENLKSMAILFTDKMSPPIIDIKNPRKNIPYWKINFEIENKKKWQNFLKYLEFRANAEVKKDLINQFEADMNILNMKSKIMLENIDQKIANEIYDYEVSIKNRLAFLREQLQIARKLDIKTNSLDANNFQSNNTVVTNIKSENIKQVEVQGLTENSYYLKGYEMIDKEINLINSRNDGRLFIPSLIELEKTKRTILQDKKIERLKNLFMQTPVYSQKGFVASKIDYNATLYSSTPMLKIAIISTTLGLLISFVYIFFNYLIVSNRK